MSTLTLNFLWTICAFQTQTQFWMMTEREVIEVKRKKFRLTSTKETPTPRVAPAKTSHQWWRRSVMRVRLVKMAKQAHKSWRHGFSKNERGQWTARSKYHCKRIWEVNDDESKGTTRPVERWWSAGNYHHEESRVHRHGSVSGWKRFLRVENLAAGEVGCACVLNHIPSKENVKCV